MTIGEIQNRQRGRKTLSEGLACAQVEFRVTCKMARRRLAVGESRPVGEIQRGKRAARQIQVETRIRRVALIVVQRESSLGRAEVRQAAIDGAETVRGLIRIREMELADTPHSGRADGQFVAADQRT